MSDSSDDTAWLFDFISSFLRSPVWTTPLNNFVDQHASEFAPTISNPTATRQPIGEENKLIWTEIHAKFITLVENLLTTNLHALGITEEQFVLAVQAGMRDDKKKQDGLARIVFGQILAVDDFLTFKKMMIQRNAELELESMQTLSSARPSDEEEAQLQLELALALSQAEAQAAPSAPPAPASSPSSSSSSSSKSKSSSKSSKKKHAFSDEDLALALKLSMLDVERTQTEYEREQAEMEHAIAMSLAAEAEWLKVREMMEMVEKEEREKKSAADKNGAASSSSVSSSSSSSIIPASSPPPKSISTVSSPPLDIEHKYDEQPSPPPAVKVAPLPTPTTAISPISAKAASLPTINAPVSSSKLSALPPLTKLPSVAFSSSSSSAPLPSLAEAQKQHESNVAHAATLFAQNQSVLQSSRALLTSTTTKGLSDEELQRRKELMQKQREILLERKRMGREKELKEFEERKMEKEKSVAPGVEATSPSSSVPSELERHKQVLQGALVEHLKSVHSEIEIKRAASQHQREFTASSLSDQFALLEQTTRKKEASLMSEKKEIERQVSDRRQQMQQIVANMTQQ